MKIDIQKAKITRHNTLEVEYVRTEKDDNGGNSETEVSEKHEALVHADMIAAFDKLIPHMVLICHLQEGHIIGKGKGKLSVDNAPKEHFLEFTVTSFSIGGGGEGVTISGNQKLNAGQVFNINTPFQKYEDEMGDYSYGAELAEAVEGCIFEVKAYLEGKCAAKQMDIQYTVEPQEREEAA